MARLQILELPEGSGDDRPPFVLVVDQWTNPFHGQAHQWAAEIGARAVLVFEDTVDIPANEAPVDLRDGQTAGSQFTLKVGDQDVQRVVESVIRQTPQGPRLGKQVGHGLAQDRTGIARDMDRFAKWKTELTDALGMDRTRDWDDIRNAARGLRRKRDAQAEAIERVRNLHRPVEHRGQSICAECSGWDGSTTDNSPCAYEHCPTLRALAGDQEQK